MKKLLCLLLCLVMLLGVLAGCAKKDPANTDPTGSSDPQGDSVSSDVARKDMVFEDFSVNGTKRDFVMAVRANRYHYLWQDEDSKDRVKSGTYKRNKFIEDKFGIKFVKKEIADNAASWTTALSATDTSIDLAVPDFWWLMEHKGVLTNLSDRTELQFDQPYWYDGYNDNVTINNKLYTVAGDATLEIWENIEVIFFNKSMAGDRDLYQMVDGNQWTIDKMLSIAKEVAVGLDDSDSSNDVYGSMYDAHSNLGQIFAAGIKLVTTGENGAIEIIAQSRSINLDIADKVKALLHDNTTVSQIGSVKLLNSTARSNISEKTAFFNSNKVMFYATALYLAQYINNVDKPVEFGILPMPKYAEDDSYTSTAYGFSPFGIPKVAQDLHFSAVILDALNYYSEEYTLSAFYEQTLKGQLASGSKDVEMLDMVKDNIYFDLGWLLEGYENAFKVYGAFSTAIAKNEQVQLSAAMTSATSCLPKLIEFYNQ